MLFNQTLKKVQLVLLSHNNSEVYNIIHIFFSTLSIVNKLLWGKNLFEILLFFVTLKQIVQNYYWTFFCHFVCLKGTWKFNKHKILPLICWNFKFLSDKQIINLSYKIISFPILKDVASDLCCGLCAKDEKYSNISTA